MKVYKLIILCLIIISFSACDSEECCVNPPESEATLIGEWRLDKLCFSNGASTCNEGDLWEPDYSECVTFTEDTFLFDRDGEICSGTYVMTEWGFDMTPDASSACIFENAISYNIIELLVDKLTMSPFCTEGCPHVYVRK